MGKLEERQSGQLLGLKTLGRVLELLQDLEKLRGMSILGSTESGTLLSNEISLPFDILFQIKYEVHICEN